MRISKHTANSIKGHLIGSWEGSAKAFNLREPDEPTEIIVMRKPLHLLIILVEELGVDLVDMNLFEGNTKQACLDAIKGVQHAVDSSFHNFEKYPEWMKFNQYITTLITDLSINQAKNWK